MTLPHPNLDEEIDGLLAIKHEPDDEEDPLGGEGPITAPKKKFKDVKVADLPKWSLKHFMPTAKSWLHKQEKLPEAEKFLHIKEEPQEEPRRDLGVGVAVHEASVITLRYAGEDPIIYSSQTLPFANI